jgi:signal transduction histidine kinase
MQLKSVLALAVIVIGVAAAGGWLYLSTTAAWLSSNDRVQATRLLQSLAMAAQHDLRDRQVKSLQQLASDFVTNDGVRFVAILDAEGKTVVSASAGCEPAQWHALVAMPVTVSETSQPNADTMTLARPILVRDSSGERGELIGAARMVIDTSASASNLARNQRLIWMIAGLIVAFAIPLGYLLVWRVLVQPIRRLVGATRRVAAGDLAARSGLRRNDEIGDLSIDFDAMVDEVERARGELLEANQRLEQKVALRTEELQRSNLRLRQEMTEKEDFLRAVSHDLNSPLRNVAGLAGMLLLRWRAELPEEVVRRLERIQANVEAGTSLITDLLELSRIKRCPQKKRLVDVGELLTEVREAFEFALKDRGISLEIQGPMPTLFAERTRCRQVFQNLLDNAIKYMRRPSGGRIEIGYRFVDGMHQFHVADNGPGIPAEEQQRIFHVFQRLETPGTASVEGRGVGLAVVRQVASSYDGLAWVRSEPEHGSAFYVSFDPRLTCPPAAASADSPHPWRADAATPATPASCVPASTAD